MSVLSRLVVIGTLALAAGLTLPSQSFAKDVKIGVLMPLTGRYAGAGQSTVRGIKMVVNNVNASGGIKSLDHGKIHLVIADDGSEPTQASTQARRLMSSKKVSFVLGPYATPAAEAFERVAARDHVGGVGLQTTLVPKTQYFSTISITAKGFGKAYANLVEWLKSKGAKIHTVAITYADNDYGKTVAKSAAAALKEQGVKILKRIPVNISVKDYSPIVLKLKSLNPDAVISVVYFRDGVLLQKARYNLNYTSPPIWIGGSAGFTDSRLWNTLGKKVAKKTLTRSFGLALYAPDAKLPGLKVALKKAHATYPNKNIDQAFMFGVQGARFLVRALEKARTTDPKKVNTAFRGLHFKADDPAIVLPIFVNGTHYRKNGTLANSVATFIQWKNGKRHVVYPESLATTKPVIVNGK